MGLEHQAVIGREMCRKLSLLRHVLEKMQIRYVSQPALMLVMLKDSISNLIPWLHLGLCLAIRLVCE